MDVPLEENLNIKCPAGSAIKLTLRGIILPNQILKERTARVLCVLRENFATRSENLKVFLQKEKSQRLPIK